MKPLVKKQNNKYCECTLCFALRHPITVRGQLLLQRAGSTSGIQLWHLLRVCCTSQHRGVFSLMCLTGFPDHNMSHQWCSDNPLILLCPQSSDRVKQCPENPPGELCARIDRWDFGGFLPDTTEQQCLQLSSLCCV